MAYTVCVYGPMAMMSIGAGVLAGAWLLFWPKKAEMLEDLNRIRRSPLFWPVIAVCVTCIWSLVWASVSGLEFYGSKPDIHWFKDTWKLWHIVFPLILFAVLRRLGASEFRKVGKVWCFRVAKVQN